MRGGLESSFWLDYGPCALGFSQVPECRLSHMGGNCVYRAHKPTHTYVPRETSAPWVIDRFILLSFQQTKECSPPHPPFVTLLPIALKLLVRKPWGVRSERCLPHTPASDLRNLGPCTTADANPRRPLEILCPCSTEDANPPAEAQVSTWDQLPQG